MERFKKILSFILSFVLIMGGVPSPDLVNRVMAEEIVNIASTEDWDNFVSKIDGYDSLIVNLTADITITKMAGTNGRPFRGTFNGGGHTLTVNLDDKDIEDGYNGVAPFRFTNGATIRFLKVDGTITVSSHKYAAGIIGETMQGVDNIYNCISSVVINSKYGGKAQHGGLVGHVLMWVDISNCLFNGKILGSNTNQCGGLIGYHEGSIAEIKNCLYDPGTITGSEQEVDGTNSCTIIGDDDDYTLEKVYYTRPLGALQGIDGSSMSAGDLVKELGDSWEVSGSKAGPIINSNDLVFASISNFKDWYFSEGEIIHPDPVVKDAYGNLLTKGTDYDVNYSAEDDSSGGSYTLTLKAKEGSRYSGSKTVSYNVYAVSSKRITGLGTGTISDPVEPDDFSDDWTGNYVYYGKYDGNNPTKYRVLDKASTEYGGNTLLLDCDSVLFDDYFDWDNNFIWSNSNVNDSLNGDEFLNKDRNFTTVEKEAIVYSTKAAKSEKDGKGLEGTSAGGNFTLIGDGSFVPLNNDRVFLLDAREASRPSYGYINSEYGYNRKKSGDDYTWWLRTAGSYVTSEGDFSRDLVESSINNAQMVRGVSPAFNVNLSSVIFSSPIPGTVGAYKLTLSDNNLGIAVPEGSNAIRADNSVKVPYVVGGENKGNVNRVSVLILKEEYQPGKCVTTGTGGDIPSITYLKLDTDLKKDGSEGSGTFTLPDEYLNKAWGLDYHVYLLAEDVNDRYETDYASAPLEIKNVFEHDFEYTSNGADITATCKKTECSLKDKKAVLTINSPQKKIYGDTGSAEASLTGLSSFRAATILPIDESCIRYEGRDGTSYAESNAAPTGAGKYTAKITVKGVTASVDYEIIKADPVPISPSGLIVAYGQTLSDVKLYNPEGNIPGTWVWRDEGTTGVGGIGTNTFKADFTPSDSANYNAVSNVDVSITVVKANSTAAAVNANNRIFDGTEKPLVIVDDSTLAGGFMSYALGSDESTVPKDGWKDAVPKAINADTYYVWYKVIGDGYHKDTEAKCVKVTISEQEEPKEPEKKIVEKTVSSNTLNIAGKEITVDTVVSSEEDESGKGYSVGQVELPDEVALSLFNNLSEEEKEQVKNGKKFSITISVNEAKIDMENEEVKKNKENADKKIKEVTGGTVEAKGIMLDMRLFVQVGNGEKKETEPADGSGKIAFTVKVPVEMKNSDDSIVRTFYLVHIHDDGKVEIVSSGTGTEIPAETDSFSYWYLTYVDEKKVDDKKDDDIKDDDKKEDDKKKDDSESSVTPSAEKVITAADNLPMAYSEETKGDFKISYCHEIPFFGKAKPDHTFFGDIKVTYGGKEYKAAKIKVNKKKYLIQITGLEGADKDTVKAVKKATKGSNGLSFKVNPYYVKTGDKVTPKFKKDGSIKSLKVEIKGKDYKVKKGEFSYDVNSKTVVFDGDNLKGSWTVP